MLDASAKGREMPPIPTPGTGPQLSKRARAFRTCEHCDYDFATDEGERGCHYYGCPSLPEELDVWCPTCLYNFMVDDGNPACGETPSRWSPTSTTTRCADRTDLDPRAGPRGPDVVDTARP
jgi:hypothetical protein